MDKPTIKVEGPHTYVWHFCGADMFSHFFILEMLELLNMQVSSKTRFTLLNTLELPLSYLCSFNLDSNAEYGKLQPLTHECLLTCRQNIQCAVGVLVFRHAY